MDECMSDLTNEQQFQQALILPDCNSLTSVCTSPIAADGDGST